MTIDIRFESLEEIDAFVKRWNAGAEKETAPAPVQEEETPAVPTNTEDLLVEVRKMLAEINKQSGGNVAPSIIREITGKTKLAEVLPEELPALKEEAKKRLAG